MYRTAAGSTEYAVTRYSSTHARTVPTTKSPRVRALDTTGTWTRSRSRNPVACVIAWRNAQPIRGTRPARNASSATVARNERPNAAPSPSERAYAPDAIRTTPAEPRRRVERVCTYRRTAPAAKVTKNRPIARGSHSGSTTQYAVRKRLASVRDVTLFRTGGRADHATSHTPARPARSRSHAPARAAPGIRPNTREPRRRARTRSGGSRAQAWRENAAALSKNQS